MFQTLRFRLTFWHTLIFAVMALVVFGIAYQTTANQLLASLSEDLQDTAVEFSDLYRLGGIKALRGEVESESLSHDNRKFYARYINNAGQTLIVNHPAQWTQPLPKPNFHGPDMQWQDVAINHADDRARVLALRSHDNGWIQVGISLQDYQIQLENIIRIFAWSLIVVVAVGVLAGWWLVRHVFAAVDQVRRTAVEIGEGELDRRLVLDGHGQELVELADVFNTMLDRIQQLLGEVRDVSDHIAHDLRTPIARIRGMAEGSLTEKQHEAGSKDEALAAIIEECDRLSTLINTMLEIAQTDSGLTHLEVEAVDIDNLLREALDLFLPVAEDAGIDMQIKSAEGPLPLTGDAGRLQRLIANLLDNAIKFTPAGGHINCAVSRSGAVIELIIADTGIGISEVALAHIFERFYRADNSRSMPGNGLGLSYAQSIARAHGGDIRIISKPEQGTTVTVSLPV